MRTPMITGNWKMYTTVKEAVSLVNKLILGINDVKGVETVICPPFISIYPVFEIIQKSNIALGAQNMYYEKKGAFTGEIAPLMLTDYCKYVIIGHSERRNYFSETDSLINQKVKSAFESSIIPILCVGENLSEMEGGVSKKVIEAQVRGALRGIKDIQSLVFAYEPVWAIGSGRSATPQIVKNIIVFIRKILQSIYGDKTANTVRILYGGSVTLQNIRYLIVQAQIDGALVGGASLKFDEFSQIVKITAEINQSAS